MWLEDYNISNGILAIIVCILVCLLWQRKHKNSPPCKKGLPLLGVLFSLGKFPEKTMTKWTKQYGPIYMIKVGLTDILVIGSRDVAYEAFAKLEHFNDRPQSIAMFTGGKGIVFVNKSDPQKEQRRFALNTLRLFGMGRRNFEPQLIQISNTYCDKIDALCENNGKSKPFLINHMMFDLVSSVISHMIFGHDVCADNEEFFTLIHSLNKQGIAFFLASVLMFAPILKHVFPFSYVWNEGIEFQSKFHALTKKEIKKHIETFDVNNPRDYVDCFLKEINKLKESSDEPTDESTFPAKSDESDDEEDFQFSDNWQHRSSFDEEQLVASVLDLFVAGTETTATTLSWIFLFMSKYPEIQQKMQNEIDEVIGQSGVPRMALMDKLPYVQAVVQEVLRIRPILPLSVVHMAAKDAMLRGYIVPKGAIILTNVWGIHHDNNLWPESEKFLPERHLDENGKFQKSDNWMPFNVGARNCLGQQLAKMELFLTTVMLFRRFKFFFEPGYEPDMDGENVVVLRPTSCEVCAQRR